jgi:hypothetical protein
MLLQKPLTVSVASPSSVMLPVKVPSVFSDGLQSKPRCPFALTFQQPSGKRDGALEALAPVATPQPVQKAAGLAQTT